MGAISSGVYPAIPQPTGVTRNFSSGCSLAEAEGFEPSEPFGSAR